MEKKAAILPIFKKGNSSVLANYRPMANEIMRACSMHGKR
jgi:hypothetical protein